MSKEIEALTSAGKYDEAIKMVANSGDKKLQAKYLKYWRMKDFSPESIKQATTNFNKLSTTNLLNVGLKAANKLETK